MISTTLREDNHVEYIGLSTDQKPITNVRNGSTFIEMDTSSIYLFDESSKTWLIIEGGGGGSDARIPTPTVEDAQKVLAVDNNGNFKLIYSGDLYTKFENDVTCKTTSWIRLAELKHLETFAHGMFRLSSYICTANGNIPLSASQIAFSALDSHEWGLRAGIKVLSSTDSVTNLQDHEHHYVLAGSGSGGLTFNSFGDLNGLTSYFDSYDIPSEFFQPGYFNTVNLRGDYMDRGRWYTSKWEDDLQNLKYCHQFSDYVDYITISLGSTGSVGPLFNSNLPGQSFWYFTSTNPQSSALGIGFVYIRLVKEDDHCYLEGLFQVPEIEIFTKYHICFEEIGSQNLILYQPYVVPDILSVDDNIVEDVEITDTNGYLVLDYIAQEVQDYYDNLISYSPPEILEIPWQALYTTPKWGSYYMHPVMQAKLPNIQYNYHLPESVTSTGIFQCSFFDRVTQSLTFTFASEFIESVDNIKQVLTSDVGLYHTLEYEINWNDREAWHRAQFYTQNVIEVDDICADLLYSREQALPLPPQPSTWLVYREISSVAIVAEIWRAEYVYQFNENNNQYEYMLQWLPATSDAWHNISLPQGDLSWGDSYYCQYNFADNMVIYYQGQYYKPKSVFGYYQKLEGTEWDIHLEDVFNVEELHYNRPEGSLQVHLVNSAIGKGLDNTYNDEQTHITLLSPTHYISPSYTFACPFNHGINPLSIFNATYMQHDELANKQTLRYMRQCPISIKNSLGLVNSDYFDIYLNEQLMTTDNFLVQEKDNLRFALKQYPEYYQDEAHYLDWNELYQYAQYDGIIGSGSCKIDASLIAEDLIRHHVAGYPTEQVAIGYLAWTEEWPASFIQIDTNYYKIEQQGFNIILDEISGKIYLDFEITGDPSDLPYQPETISIEFLRDQLVHGLFSIEQIMCGTPLKQNLLDNDATFFNDYLQNKITVLNGLFLPIIEAHIDQAHVGYMIPFASRGKIQQFESTYPSCLGIHLGRKRIYEPRYIVGDYI